MKEIKEKKKVQEKGTEEEKVKEEETEKVEKKEMKEKRGNKEIEEEEGVEMEEIKEEKGKGKGLGGESRIDRKKSFILEGEDRPRRRHRHANGSSLRHHIFGNDNVTKIEVELEEAPDRVEDRLPAILVGSVPSELDSTVAINSTYPDGVSTPGGVVVRAEEALIVILVLVLWVAAIALFFNRWGKIRMLEPYQPKFQQQHRQSCALSDQTSLPHVNFSKFNIHCLEHPTYAGSSRPRQNSVFVGSSASLLAANQESPRRTKSAFDLQSLVMAECTVLSPPERALDEPGRRMSLKPFAEMPVNPGFRASLQRERGMSVCHFDRTDVLARPPLQRDRGMSICHFDRTDVLARPLLLQRERGMSVCHFDRTDVLARTTLREPRLRDRRTSVCNILERGESVPARTLQRDYRQASCHNVDRVDMVIKECVSTSNVARTDPSWRTALDMPSCSNTPASDLLGYKATRV